MSPRRRRAATGFGFAAGAVALACLAVGGCVPPAPQPAPPPAPAPAPAPPPPIITQVPTPTFDNWMDVPATSGDWRYRQAGTTTRASFGEATGAPVFELVCEGGRVLLLRSGAGGEALIVRTETIDRTLAATRREGATMAQLHPRDSLLDAMAFSKGRFAIETQGQPGLYLPAWPEVTRVIEDCR